MISDPQLIADSFNSYFTNIGANLADQIIRTPATYHHYLKGSYPESFVFFPTNELEISDYISILNPNKSFGIDSIDPFIIKQISTSIVPLLTYIFNKSMESGKVPDQLKSALVTAVYKADDRTLFSNYRPISILPIFSKLLEKVIYTRLLNYLDKLCILSANQYGFRKKHSTYMALIDLIDNVSQAIDDKKIGLGVFVDLSKAFDTVDHDILINKLSHGIRGVQLSWFADYLKNRTQRVKFKDCISSPRTINCGVPKAVY